MSFNVCIYSPITEDFANNRITLKYSCPNHSALLFNKIIMILLMSVKAFYDQTNYLIVVQHPQEGCVTESTGRRKGFADAAFCAPSCVGVMVAP